MRVVSTVEYLSLHSHPTLSSLALLPSLVSFRCLSQRGVCVCVAQRAHDMRSTPHGSMGSHPSKGGHGVVEDAEAKVAVEDGAIVQLWEDDNKFPDVKHQILLCRQ